MEANGRPLDWHEDQQMFPTERNDRTRQHLVNGIIVQMDLAVVSVSDNPTTRPTDRRHGYVRRGAKDYFSFCRV